MNLSGVPEWIVPVVSGLAGWLGSFLTRYLVEKKKRNAETRQAEIGSASTTEEFYNKSLSSRQVTIEAAFQRLSQLESEILRLVESESDLREQLIEKNAEIKHLKNRKSQ